MSQLCPKDELSPYESRCAVFRGAYGVDPMTASNLVQPGGPMVTMLQHMYFEAMDDLRTASDIAGEGARLQGYAQALWDLLNIPAQLDEIKNLNL
jgi:hypothetical protein